MPSPEENALRHDPLGAYDRAQAHEYYMRTRVLKGRKAATIKAPVSRSKAGSPSKSVRSISGQQRVVTTKTASERAKEKKALKAHVVALQNRLAALKKILAELTKQAKARSGVKTKKAVDTSPAAVAERKTAAAKTSKTYYEKHKAKILAKAKAEAEANSPTDLEAKIQEVIDKIKEMRAELKSKLKP